MKITRMEITNVGCFPKAVVNFSSNINVIVGPNNSGKTTLLDCIGLLQGERRFYEEKKRLDTSHGAVHINVLQRGISGLNARTDGISAQTNWGSLKQFIGDSDIGNWTGFPNMEPNNVIIPYQSKRKVNGYSEGITLSDLEQVTGNLSNLYAKVDRISSPEFQPAYGEYTKACEEILGFRISSSSSSVGKKATYVIRNEKNIPIDRMGEGVPNLLGLIVDLCRVEEKIFLIEEPENDIHPTALKKLLSLIIAKSDKNQFIITTHSNIVLRHLGSAISTKLFKTSMSFKNRVPTSVVEEVLSADDRMLTLEEMGYELFDLGIWDNWIFLEESSAEKVIRDYLIPWFIPSKAGKIRTYSARCLSEVKPKFDDFNRLFVFLHLQQMYKNKVWVIIDSGPEENEVLRKLKEVYIPSGWNEANFRQLSNHDFELYYPERFKEKVESTLAGENKKDKREMKRILLDEVLSFIAENEELAMKEFAESASEVILMLKDIFNTQT